MPTHPTPAGGGPVSALSPRDGHLVVMCMKEKFWRRLCDALGRPGLAADPRFEDFAARGANREALLAYDQALALFNRGLIRRSARNLFDRDPPYAAGFGGNSTGYPGFLYSSEGRFVYLSVSRKF